MAREAEGHLDYMIFQRPKEKESHEDRGGGVGLALQRDLEGSTGKAPSGSAVKVTA